jgi:hypothetical protein
MNEINDNLLKLQSQVSQINDMFKKQTNNQIINSDINKILNLSYVRIAILFTVFTIILYFSKPDFCCNEVVNEETFFKEKVINLTYVVGASIISSAIIFHFTNQFRF